MFPGTSRILFARAPAATLIYARTSLGRVSGEFELQLHTQPVRKKFETKGWMSRATSSKINACRRQSSTLGVLLAVFACRANPFVTIANFRAAVSHRQFLVSFANLRRTRIASRRLTTTTLTYQPMMKHTRDCFSF